MKKISIIVYNIANLGGAERVAVNVANELCKKYKVSLVSLVGQGVHKNYYIDDQIDIVFLNIKSGRLRKQVLLSFLPLKKYLVNNEIDIALLEGNYCGILCSTIKLFCKTKFIFCDHGSFLSQYNERRIRCFRKITSLLCNHTVVLTERSKNDYMKYFGLKEGKISCIYNWVDESLVNPERVYNKSCRKIISVGRLVKEKGLDLLIQVAKQVLPLHKDWVWMIYGDGEMREWLDNAIKEEGLQGQLMLAGEYNDISEAYGDASILVLPSYREGMPLVLLEGKCFKLPSVSFDINSGPREIILDDVNGYLVPAYDTENMAKKLDALISEPELRFNMSLHSYDNLDEFRKDSIIRQWEALIEALCGGL